ncbi:MAG: type II toxin-antitoxin system prevent-host-death family antitoxin [Myxococcaceae bacterium]|nr:MAG: type II toxin-antitoxin system prevent-host-death family antitoxin [Myxococcaceae bacterium]
MRSVDDVPPVSAKKTTYTVREFRLKLRKLLKRVERGERITVTRAGRPVAVMVHPRELEELRRITLKVQWVEAKRREIVDLKEL